MKPTIDIQTCHVTEGNIMKCVCLVSGGIDSPVAAHLMLLKGIDLTFVHLGDASSSENGNNKILQLVGLLENLHGMKLDTYFISPKDNQEAFQVCNSHIRCVLCKRMMIRVAQEVAHHIGARTLVMGDSLGQVASQTSQNIEVIEDAVEIPILRPLIGFDKAEIIEIAKEIGTYDISIKNAPDCPYLPKKPSTQASLRRVLMEEKKIDVELLTKRCLDGATIQ